MITLAAPSLLAWLLFLGALALHPLVRAEAWLPGHAVLLATLLLLTATALLARAAAARDGARAPAWLTSVGALVALAGVGLDEVRGHSGSVTLVVGQESANFDETGPGGRSLGLRPLGFRIGLDAVTPSGVRLTLPGGGTATLDSGRALRSDGFWLADPLVSATGGVAFSALEVEPERSVAIRVHRQPFALVAALGGLLLVAGIVWDAFRSPTDIAPIASGDGVLVAGACLVAALLLADSGEALRWRFAVAGAGGPEPLEGVGILLGLALVAAFGGVLLLGGARLAGGVDVVAFARRALWAAVLAGSAAVGLAVLRLALRSGGLTPSAALPVVGLTLAVVLVAAALGSHSSALIDRPEFVAAVTVAVTAAVLLIGVRATVTQGSYAVPATAAAAATALLGLAAREPAALPGLRRLVLLVAVLALLLRPA